MRHYIDVKMLFSVYDRWVEYQSIKHSTIVNYDSRFAVTKKLQILLLYSRNLQL